MKPIITLIVLLLFLSPALADENKSGSGVIFSFGKINLDQAVADGEFIEPSASYIQLGFEIRRQRWLYGAGLSGYFYDDNARFSQQVVDQFGDESTAKSTADAFNLYGLGGYSLPLGRAMYLQGLGGYEIVMQSSRAIANCQDCAEEDIEVKSGAFFMPRFLFAFDRWNFSLSYNVYLSGDVEDGVLASVGFKL